MGALDLAQMRGGGELFPSSATMFVTHGESLSLSGIGLDDL